MTRDQISDLGTLHENVTNRTVDLKLAGIRLEEAGNKLARFIYENSDDCFKPDHPVLVERERCAKIALEHGAVDHCDCCCEIIAAEIRKKP